MGTILIFDSSAVTCHTVSKQLRTVGFDTLQARSLGGARAALASRPVDLVILDMAATGWPGTPDAGGMTFLRELRRDPTYHKTPVIILTSSARDSDRIDARAAGAVAFLTKPVSTRELLVTVNTAFALHAPAAHAPAPQAERGSSPSAGSPALRFPYRRDARPEWGPAAAAAAATPPAAAPVGSVA